MDTKLKTEQVLELLRAFYKDAPPIPVIEFSVPDIPTFHPDPPIAIEMKLTDCGESAVGLIIVHPRRDLDDEGRHVIEQGSREIAYKLLGVLNDRVASKLSASRNN